MTDTPHKNPHISLLEIIDSRYDDIKRKLENMIINDNGCWVYQGRNDKGKKLSYGRVSIYLYGRLWTFRAHRISYAFYNGIDPAEQYVCHKCDNPSCINPDHLFLGTSKDNMVDMVNKGRNKAMGGEQNPCAKIGESDVLSILERIKQGHTNTAISRDFPVTHSMISSIRRGKAWASLAQKVGYSPTPKYSSLRAPGL